MTDQLGQEINPGCYIAYPHAHGSSSASIRIGRVVNAYMQQNQWSKKQEPRIRLRGVDDGWNGPMLRQKDSTLLFPDRTIVLRADQIPDNVHKLFMMLDAITDK